MNQTLAPAVRRDRTVLVRPRRRGETTPTTVTVEAEVALLAANVPVEAILPALMVAAAPIAIEFQSIETPVAQPASQRATSERTFSADQRQQYQSLADEMLSRATPGRGHGVAIYSASANLDCAEIVDRLATIFRERPGLRVNVASEIGFGREPSRFKALRDACDLQLFAGGNASGASANPMEAHCDAGYLAIEMGRTDSAAARLAVAALRQRGVRVLGCIVIS